MYEIIVFVFASTGVTLQYTSVTESDQFFFRFPFMNMDGATVEHSTSNQFSDVLFQKHQIIVPKYLRNIFESMGLDTHIVLQEANEQYGNNDSNTMDFDFDEIERYARSEEYISLSSRGQSTNYYGPTCPDRKKFKLKLGDKLIIKKILRIVKENRGKKNYWEIQRISDAQK